MEYKVDGFYFYFVIFMFYIYNGFIFFISGFDE